MERPVAILFDIDGSIGGSVDITTELELVPNG